MLDRPGLDESWWTTLGLDVVLSFLLLLTHNDESKKLIHLLAQMHDEYNVICKGLLKKETNVGLFAGLRVELSTGEHGVIDSSFGQSGKLKIRLPGKRQCSSAVPMSCPRSVFLNLFNLADHRRFITGSTIRCGNKWA